MRFCEYLKFLHNYIGTDKTQADFVIFITTLFLHEPITDEEKQDDENDFYNPLNQLKQRTLEKIYTGEENHKVSKKNARILRSRYSPDIFENYLMEFDCDTQKRFSSELNQFGFKSRINNFEKKASDIYFRYLSAMVEGKDYIVLGDKSAASNIKEIAGKNEPKDLSIDCKRFIINHEDEIPLLPLCMIAENVFPLHKNARQMYNDYQLLSSQDKEKILEHFKCKEISFTDNWVKECIERFKDSINTLQLSNKKEILYDNAKYLHGAINYDSTVIENIDPFIFATPIESQSLKKLLQQDYLNRTVQSYIEMYLNNCEYAIEAPLDALWDTVDLGNCSEEEMCFWVMRFVLSACYNISAKSNIESPYDIEEYNIETFEDMYYFTLLQLYLTYTFVDMIR